MQQSAIEKNIDRIKTRSFIDNITEKLKQSGALPKNYPNHKNKKPYELLRSELKAYKETHGKDFNLPIESLIIEDL